MTNEGSTSEARPGELFRAGAHAVSPEGDAEPLALGTELRRRRQQLQLSVRRAAQRAGVSPTVIAEIESGKRLPSLRTVRRISEGLGLYAPAAVLVRRPAPREPLETHLARLGACIWAMGGHARISDLAAALELPAAAVREQLPVLAPRLAACGVMLVDDSVEVRCTAVADASSALELLGCVVNERRRRALSDEAITALAYIGWHREVTRRELEMFRSGADCESLLARLSDAGYVAAVRDSEGRRPNRYRLTALALESFGVASLEELHEHLASNLKEPAPADGPCDDAP